MGAGLIRIILTGLDFDVLLPITDITGRQAYFSLITSNSSTSIVCNKAQTSWLYTLHTYITMTGRADPR